MRFWALCLVVLVLATFVPTRATVAAQPETITLRMPLRPGDALFYTSTASSTSTAEAAGNRQSFTIQFQGREAHRVLSVDAQGNALVEVVLEDAQLVGDTTAEAFSIDPTLIRVSAGGKVIERMYGDPLFGVAAEFYPFPLPDRPVAVNDTWTQELTVEESGVTTRATAIYTFAGLERRGDIQVARISGRIRGTVSSAVLESIPAEADARTSGTIRATVDIDWLVEPGRLLRAAQTVSIDIQSDLKLGEQALQLKLLSNTTASATALPASDLPRIEVATEFLITPGQGIGTWTLSMSMPQLNSVLGAATSQAMRETYRAQSVSWASGLVGFVDPTDPAKLVGLEVADRKYRTERGIGFGSTVGAALLAYGLTPKSVDLPALGAKLLVYTDLGIAFGITTTEEHAARGPNHAPIGAVDFVLVFPPSGASIILTGF